MVLLPSQDNSKISSLNASAEGFYFTSTLSCRYESDLEALMFFNPQQKKFRNAVSHLVEYYGNPKIIKDGDRLRLQIGSSSAQTLFCFDRPTDGELIGVVVYIRESIEQLAIIHLAVKEEYLMSGCYGDRALALRLIQKVQEIGARLKGVESITILYERSLKKIPVRQAAKRQFVINNS
jgi:hypothetical protein